MSEYWGSDEHLFNMVSQAVGLVREVVNGREFSDQDRELVEDFAKDAPLYVVGASKGETLNKVYPLANKVNTYFRGRGDTISESVAVIRRLAQCLTIDPELTAEQMVGRREANFKSACQYLDWAGLHISK